MCRAVVVKFTVDVFKSIKCTFLKNDNNFKKKHFKKNKRSEGLNVAAQKKHEKQAER